MLKIKNKNLIKSILITLSLVITLSFGLVLFKDNVNVVKADSVEVNLDSQVKKVTSSTSAPVIDISYFDVKSPNWVEKFDFLTMQDFNSGRSTDYLYFNIANSSNTQEFWINSNLYAYVYYLSYDTSNNTSISSKNNLLSMSWGYSETNDILSLTFEINTSNNIARGFFMNVSDYVIVTMYNNRYFVTSSPALYSAYNSYLTGLTGSSLTENELYQNGYNVGYNKGFNDGNNNVKNNPNNYDLYTKYQYDTNYTNGKNDGITIGEDNIKNNPNNYDLYTKTQYDSNYTNGKNLGYSTGYTAGVNDSNDYTFIGLIGSVIDAPIKAFTGLFNFELLGFNLLNFVKALFTLMVIIVVARFIVAKM